MNSAFSKISRETESCRTQHWTPLSQREQWSLYLFYYKLWINLNLCCVSSSLLYRVSAACPVGYFKSVSGSVPCLVCPSNSRTSQEGSSVCECRSSFYRAANDANSSACTSELCLFVCLCLAPRKVFRGPQWSHLSFTLTTYENWDEVTKIQPLFYHNKMEISLHQQNLFSLFSLVFNGLTEKFFLRPFFIRCPPLTLR